MTTAIITSARDLLTRYPVLFCDVWGVLHDGVSEYEAAGDALERYRAAGGIVVLLSNAPTPAATVARVLDEKRVRRSAWDAIVSSGDVTRQHLIAQGYDAIHHIGPPRSLPLFDGLAARLVGFGDADAIVCTGLEHDAIETGETYRPLLQDALARQLPFVCANPDIVVEVGGRMLPCAGAVGVVYAAIGGAVYWAGKPHPPAYEIAFATAARIAGRAIGPREVLAVGDAAATDLAGAAAAGIDALFIAGGIHRADVMPEREIDAIALRALLEHKTLTAVAAAPALVW
jgi:HAD superfamily hydrolase (TIGR01450 family)